MDDSGDTDEAEVIGDALLVDTSTDEVATFKRFLLENPPYTKPDDGSVSYSM
ncbi:hypothetical protein AAF712_012377 [Marasmius tenuissimus]|uniref:Uncharacterized protein n=1 Tax=Marasmius tenuissimus TaxID=585030 RepID=A0ABR2ZHQ3_9AGAR